MRRDFDRKAEELNKIKLQVIGDQFVLDSQIKIMMDQNGVHDDDHKIYDLNHKKRLFELERELKEVAKHRLDLENEVRALDHAYQKELEDSYVNKMTIIKDKKFDEVNG